MPSAPPATSMDTSGKASAAFPAPRVPEAALLPVLAGAFSSMRFLRVLHVSVYIFRAFAGFVMHCTVATEDECLNLGVFGAPSSPARKLDYSAILAAAPRNTVFFLYNIDTHVLHGVFVRVRVLAPRAALPEFAFRFGVLADVVRVSQASCYVRDGVRWGPCDFDAVISHLRRMSLTGAQITDVLAKVASLC